MTKKKMFKVLALLVTISIIGGIIFYTTLSTNAAIEPSKGVKINSFTASSTNVQAGETVTLKWGTTNATKIEIIGIEKNDEVDLPLSGSLEIWPLTSTTYVLRAYGANNTMVSKSLTVNVGQAPAVSINSFKASAAEVTLGETVTLTWTTKNAVSARIIGIEKGNETVVEVNGNIEVWPTATTTYILEATGSNGAIASKSVTVTIKDEVTASPTPTPTPTPVINVKITSFTASSTTITKGDLVTLSWVTQNATSIKIVTSAGQTLSNRPASGSISVTPNKTTTFTLIASDSSGNEVSKPLTITVK